MRKFDVLVIGGGIAGMSVAYELAASARVALLEQETQPGYHTTGRSAALFSRTYGSAPVRALAAASHPFFDSPPKGFAAHPLLTPRGALIFGNAAKVGKVSALYESCRDLDPTLRLLGEGEVSRMVPVFRRGQAAMAMVEPAAMDIDVDGLLQGYRRGLLARNGVIATDAPVTGLVRRKTGWRATTPGTVFSAPLVINAAGAWADVVAGLAGIAPIGLVPKRRTAILFQPPAKVDISAWPLFCEVDEGFYVKPDAGKLLGSPADETPSEPCDAQPDDWDVATAVERIQKTTTLTIRRIGHKWAGLRSFVADKTPVAGFDGGADGFFWLAGQGGYGIQTAPALARTAASLAMGEDVPDDVAALGLTAATLSPTRLSSA